MTTPPTDPLEITHGYEAAERAAIKEYCANLPRDEAEFFAIAECEAAENPTTPTPEKPPCKK